MRQFIIAIEDYPDLTLAGLHGILCQSFPMVEDHQIRVEEINNVIDIIINGRTIQTNKKEMTYDDVVILCCDKELAEGIVYSITYRYSKKTEGSGILHPGSIPIRVLPGMIFNCFDTGNA